MTPAERYRAVLSRLGCSMAKASRILDVNERTSRRWAAGDTECPAPALRFLEFLAVRRINPDIVLLELDGLKPSLPVPQAST